MIQKLYKAYRRGWYATARIMHNRMQRSYFAYYWRTRHKKYKASPSSVPHIQDLPFVHDMCTQKDHASCIARADAIVDGYISILGSKPQQYPEPPWHTDIRLQQQDQSADATFARDQFFADIAIDVGRNADHYSKDIKVPWELSRSQPLLTLGHAYMITKNERYAKKITEWCVSWINSNPFLLGVNWCNPMEVGLRAMSWIMALSMIAHSEHVTLGFLQDAAQCLEQKRYFIANNFEWYDGRTSNHYLSDLVGYLYLCWFFEDDRNAQWAIHEIARELDKQVLSDGASYEGSTKYHQLVTEFVQYAHLLIAYAYPQYKNLLIKKLKAMHDVAWWCTPHGGSMITIGDDDSGRVVPFTFESHTIPPKETSVFLSQFGLSVYKTKKLHCTLRHHAYQPQQPTGHFHNDVGSIMLAIDGIPVIVDPGSFVYTPSVYWRNYFRSAAVHNASYVQGQEPIPLTDQLFYMDISPNTKQDSAFYAHQTQYADRGLLFRRTMRCSDMRIIIEDAWDVADTSSQLTKTLVWNMTLHPDIDIQCNDSAISLRYKQQEIAVISSSDLDFVKEQTYYAPEYGVKKATNCIRAYRPCATIKANITIITKGWLCNLGESSSR